MRKVILLMHVSLDGFVGGPQGEVDWIKIDNEMYHDVDELLKTVDTALYGRVTYQMMENYWPTVPHNSSSTQFELHHADWVEHVHKIVFSKSLDKVTWNNTRLIKENIQEEVLKLKQQPGKDMMIFGSPSIAHLFMKLDLIDAYRIMVNPVILGKGIPLFQDINDRKKLTLLQAKTFQSGVVGLHYERKCD